MLLLILVAKWKFRLCVLFL